MEHLRDLQRSPAPQVTCDLCTSSDMAVKFCEKCSCNMCEFCGHAHQKQRKTSLHQLVSLEQVKPSLHAGGIQVGVAGGVARVSLMEVRCCNMHTEQELELFCKSCDTPLCKECAKQSHTHHTLLPLDEASVQRIQVIKNLVSQAKPLTASLTESVRNIEYLLTSIQERSEATSEEIIMFVSSHMRALQEHKRSLLQQLDAAKKQKESTLRVQATHLKEVLSELHRGCEEATRVMESGASSLAFDSRVPVISKLQELVSSKLDTTAKEDDYLHFHARAAAEERSGFPMFGLLDSRGPSAAYTTAEGEGLHAAREGKTAQVRVTVHDRFKQRREGGGDKVEASMTGPDGEVVYVFVSNSEDGSYLLSYTPASLGEHVLAVLVGGKHIRGSPFQMSVVRRRNDGHAGVFHCCTFCSTEGKKHIRCGCGGTMPGGYSGCGHGHPGHPGRRHWSCCGNTVETSDCLQ